MVICLERDADLHTAQRMPPPLTVSCFSKIQIGFTFLVPAHPGSPGQRAVKRVCVCVRACVRACVRVNIETKQHLTKPSFFRRLRRKTGDKMRRRRRSDSAPRQRHWSVDELDAVVIRRCSSSTKFDGIRARVLYVAVVCSFGCMRQADVQEAGVGRHLQRPVAECRITVRSATRYQDQPSGAAHLRAVS